MMRSARSRHEEEEYEDEELVPRTGDGSFQKVEPEELNVGRKANPLRSKHSETEQRRRSKINERFQILRDLIPQNDQKRDKASFLLEVIQYIQFLQAKLDMYEGSYQGWSQEPTKLMPWSKQRNSTGPLETFTDQPQLMRNGSGQEDNIVVTSTMHTNAHNSEDSGFREVTADKALDHTTVVTNRAIPVCISAQAILLGDVAGQPNLTSLPDPGFQASLSQSQFWQSRSCAIASALPSYTLNEEELKVESDEASISNTYSQGLLNNLIQALQSSGVDLTQANISVQLDVGKRVNTGLPATSLSAKDHQNQCPDGQISTAYGVGSSCLHSDIPNKRPRT